MRDTSLSGAPIPKQGSILSRFRLAGVGVVLGVGLVAAIFFGLLQGRYLSATMSRTLGPYTDSLTDHIFANPDPDLLRRIAMRHQLMILYEPVGGEAVAFDAQGEPVPSISWTRSQGQVRALRTAPDGTRVTLYWTLWSFKESHLPLLAGLLIMLTAVVGSTFWLFQRQLKPLTWLHTGVDAVARGDFSARVPVVRNDEIGGVALAFNEMAKRVGRMIEDRERLLGDVSHELRSPITRMKVALEFMPAGDKRDMVGRDLQEMEDLIAALLEREGLRSRVGRLEGEDVDLAALAGEVAAALADQGPGVEFRSSEPATIHADPALMKMLVQNLVDNAIKFSRPDSRPVVLMLDVEGEQITLRVTDDGIGIPAGSEEKVFKPFVKLDRARGHGVGYGIGLNLCQRIVQLHGGTIRLLPRKPGGSEAVVTLPRRPA